MHDTGPTAGGASEEFWRDFLLHGDPRERRLRKIFQRIPASPRCHACAAPFGGIGRQVIRLIGKRPSERSRNLCNSCFDFMLAHRGGAEIECTMLFADVRGSTAIAEGMSAGEFRTLLDRFYRVATEAIFSNDGGVDKFVGDEVVAMFIPVSAGEDHAAKAVTTARDLRRATGHDDPGGPWLPVGAGVHTGRAWVGAVGDDSHVELTALGDVVNTAARLASAAAAGEILVSAETAAAAGLDPALPRAKLDLKGKQAPFEVVRLGLPVSATADAARP
ncbi:MAG: adenylate/guanylate cyclase domain-containing protein [Chloroflexi bacterium]|nr:adenylate/guanylate cyclase domain-containing protein [Chloroflexota bacterium]